MILSPQQDRALSTTVQRLDAKEPITIIAGYAGSGKTTIVRYMVEGLDMMDNTMFVTFTGKASLVLNQKGLPATTIHHMIYKVYKNKRTGKLNFILKDEIDPDVKLIVVDEISMVSDALMQDLLSFGIPIIGLGDPGQLPPIGRDHGLLEKPHVFLSEIHRQAADNPIIAMSMKARKGEMIPFQMGENVAVIRKNQISMDSLLNADQVICGYNNTRKFINNSVRKHLGYKTLYPQAGEKLICLKNNWDIEVDEYPLINGTIGTMKNMWSEDKAIHSAKTLTMDFQPDFLDDSFYEALNCDATTFIGGEPPKVWIKGKLMDNYKLCQFDYGYAITCHKSQGSEFEKVIVFEEVLRRDMHNKWLYTAITRAKDKLIIVK